MELINIDTIVEEIERRLEAIANVSSENRELAAIQGAQQYELINLIQFIDTLEVREVDLEKEYKKFINCNNGRSMFETAKHFFELGLKASKPKKASKWTEEDDVRRRSTIQILEYARCLNTYNLYGKATIDKNIAWLEKQGQSAFE